MDRTCLHICGTNPTDSCRVARVARDMLCNMLRNMMTNYTLKMDDLGHDSYEPEGSGMHDQPALDMQVQEPFEPYGTKRGHNMVVRIRR